MAAEVAQAVTRTVPAATRDAIRDEMRRDPSVVCWGEDITGGAGSEVLSEREDAWPGVMPAYAGLAAEFGPERVRDMPIAEAGFIGMAVGAAMGGMRPVVDLMFIDFLTVCLDQIANQAAKNPYMFGGQVTNPVVIRTAFGAGRQFAGQHSGAHYSIFAHYAGVKVVAPSTPYDAKGLMTAAIRDDNVVVFCENRNLATVKDEIPDRPYTVPIGKAALLRDGDDVALIAASRMVHVAREAAERLAEAGVQAALLDLRTLAPLDVESIVSVVAKTGRVVIIDEDGPRCSISADVAAVCVEHAFEHLEAPVARVTPPHVPIPFSPPLEASYLPDADRVVAAVHGLLDKNRSSKKALYEH